MPSVRIRQVKAVLQVAFFSIIALAAFGGSSSAQTDSAPPADSLPRIRFAVMDDYVRDVLAADWDAHSRDHALLERGYCLGYQLDFWAGELAYRVTQISYPDPDSTRAGPSGIRFSCAGKFPGHLAELHVHPASSCLGPDGPCFKGGVYAWQCKESDQDARWLAWIGQPFSMIQCSREGVIYFLPPAAKGLTL
jgi:hypothetical protein